MHKGALLLISLSLTSCASFAPRLPSPEIVQYAVHADVGENLFYGINNKTGKIQMRRADDPEMKGAQCLSIEDYRAQELWISKMKSMYETRCRK